MTYDTDTRWWNLQGDQLREKLDELTGTTRPWINASISDHCRLRWHYERDRLINQFGWKKALSLGNKAVAGDFAWFEEDGGLASPNLVREGVDTVGAWILENQPPLTVKASGAKFEDRYSVEEFEAALDSIFNTEENQRVLSAVGHEAALAGLAWVWPRFALGRICVEHLQDWQVQYDPFEVAQGGMRTVHVHETRDRADVLYQVTNWAPKRGRTKLLNLVKEMRAVRYSPATRDGFRDLFSSEMDALHGVRDATDSLTLTHSYRVASFPGADDGRYVLRVRGSGSSDSVVVLDTKFTRTTLPVVPVTLLPSPKTLQGTGFGHLLLAWQHTVDRVQARTQYNLEKYGNLKLLVPAGTNEMIKAFKMAGIQVITGYQADKPEFIDPQTVRPEDLQHSDRCRQMALQHLGINTMMTRGSTDLGANASGAAQREEYYRSLDRFSRVAAEWHHARSRLAAECLNLLDDVLQLDAKFSASYEYLGRNRRRPWAELTKLRDRCGIGIEARGEAATRRGGRVARIQEWASQGLVSPATAKEALLTTPDTRSAARQETAGLLLVEWQLRQVIENEDWSEAVPDADTPADVAIARATATIQRAIVEGAEYETLERLREYKATAARLLPPPAPPPNMMPPGPSGPSAAI